MKKSLRAVAALLACAAVAASAGPAPVSAEEVVKVACVGDSITAGTEATNYPMYLQELLGDGYEVKNFGLGGAAVRHEPESDGTYFWYDSAQYKESLEYDADVVFVMMGTNDVGSVPTALKRYFKEDYYNYLIKPYLDNGSKVVVMTSPYAYYYLLQDPDRINTLIAQYQRELAQEYDLQLIDMNAATADMRECFPDGLHGNASGYSIIAQTVYEEYFGGKICRVRAETTPGALVTAGRIGIKANESGTAVLPLLPGEHEFFASLDGYKSVYGTLTVPESESGSCKILMGEGGQNVAVGSTVTASSESDGFTAPMAADGDTETRWQAQMGDNQWILFDLGETRMIGGTRILWEPAYGESYNILVSENGTDFTTVASVTEGDGGTDEVFFDAVNARYLRIDCIKRATVYGFSMYEVQILESDGSPLRVTGMDISVMPDEGFGGGNLTVTLAVIAVVALAGFIALGVLWERRRKKKETAK